MSRCGCVGIGMGVGFCVYRMCWGHRPSEETPRPDHAVDVVDVKCPVHLCSGPVAEQACAVAHRYLRIDIARTPLVADSAFVQ
jgi:hypothetical protein